jgi:hypothetical protein
MEEATKFAMNVLTRMVAELRNEAPPAELFDIRNSNLPRTGNFKKSKQ